MTENPVATHPLILQAIADFTPRGRAAIGATNVDPDSGAVILVAEAGPDAFVPLSKIERWTRRDLRNAQTTALTTGLDTIFLARRLASWSSSRDRIVRKAPMTLQPVSYDPEANRFEVRGPQTDNNELDALLAKDAKILSIDDAFCAVVMISAGARSALRLVDPAQNPALLASPAVQFLLGAKAAIGLEIPDRAAALKAQRRTPLDADQEAAYYAALTDHVVIFGPPGTGKSEVIAEIARATLEAGHSVLVTSTVPAALTVARTRLTASGHTTPYQNILEFASPLDVAKRHSERLFEVAIIDEATRMTTSEALLVASRAKRLIICGDPKQLSVDHAAPDLFVHAFRLNVRSVMLRQHYRSASPDLFAFSNLAVYDLALRIVPTPDFGSGHGARLVECTAKSIARTPTGLVNHDEVNAVADRLEMHIASRDPRSICVIAVTAAQVAAIHAELNRRGISDAALNRPNEPFFVRLISQAQGEERDIVLFSLTFANEDGSPDKALRLFEREGRTLERLNVALSRARSRTEVFTSLAPSEINTKPSLYAADRALRLLFRALKSASLSHNAFRTLSKVNRACAFIRQDGDRLDNLGLLHGWAHPRSATRYDLGIVVRWAPLPRHIWDTAIAQLQVVGWSLAVFDEATIHNDMGHAQDEIERIYREIRFRR